MTDGRRIVTIPRHDPVDALTMGGIVQDAGLTPQQFLIDEAGDVGGDMKSLQG